MGDIMIANRPTGSNYGFQKMKLPARPFVQLIARDPDDPETFLDVFNVPYNYFTDFSAGFNSDVQGTMNGKLTTTNPWPMSSADVPRFKKFDKVMQNFVKIANLEQVQYIGSLEQLNLAIRWGWCDNDAQYFLSEWHRIACVTLHASIGESGMVYAFEYVSLACQASSTIGIDRFGYSESSDIIEDISDLFLKNGILLDFNREFEQYRVFEYDKYDNPKPLLGSYKKSLAGRQNRKDLSNNTCAYNALANFGAKKLIDCLSSQLLAVCEKSDEGEPDSNKRRRMAMYHCSTLVYTGITGAVNNKMMRDLSNQEIKGIESPRQLGFVQIEKAESERLLPRIHLKFEEVKPNSTANEKSVYGDLIGNRTAYNGVTEIKLEEKMQDDKIYSIMLNSRDCGLYRYYAGSGVSVENNALVSEQQNGENESNPMADSTVKPCNVLSVAVNIETWLAIYTGNPMSDAYINTSDGSFSTDGYAKNPVLSGSVSVNDESRNSDISKSNRQAIDACKQNVINLAMGKGSIDILGDPSICFESEQIGTKYIHLMAYDPIGNAVPYWSGIYTVTGYVHNISEGRYGTTLFLLLNHQNPYNVLSEDNAQPPGGTTEVVVNPGDWDTPLYKVTP